MILVGEMRDLETISLALTAAELGLLVLGTLHTKSASQTISRVADAFPSEQQAAVRLTLSEVLIGLCSQQLLRQGRRERPSGRHGDPHRDAGREDHDPGAKDPSDQQRDHDRKEAGDETAGPAPEGARSIEGIVTGEEAARYAIDPDGILAFAESGGRIDYEIPGRWGRVMKKTARLDQIFLKLGSANEEQIARALARQRSYGGRLGKNLVEMGIITEQQLLAALSEQFRIPTATPAPATWPSRFSNAFRREWSSRT